MATVLDPQYEQQIDSEMLYEIVDGEIVEKQMGANEILIANLLFEYLAPFVRVNKLGCATHEMVFYLEPVDQHRRPDLAFVSAERWPVAKGRPKTPTWEIVPDLACEVVSPSNTMEEVVSKVREYFTAGVRLVWVVLPDDEQVYVYDSPESIKVVPKSGNLTAEPVIPGFRIPLVELFDDESDSHAAVDHD